MVATSGSAWEPYVPRWSSEWLADEPDLLARHLEGTLVVVDLVAFSTLTERLARRGRVGAERVTQVLQPLFARMLDAAYAEGAGLLIWGGDAMVLAFDGTDHVVRAARAALAMQAVVGRRGRVEGSRLQISAGMHTGRFAAVLAGDPNDHRILVLAGSDASRVVTLEAAALAGEVRLSPESTAALPRGCAELLEEDALLLVPPAGPPSGLISRTRANEAEALLVSPAIREHLRSGGQDAEHRLVSAAFARIRGCDAVLAEEGLDALAEALDTTTRIVQAAARRHGVTLFDWVVMEDGGSFLLTAGAPRHEGHDEERILRMGRDILDADPPLPVGIGAHRGPVFVSDFGPSYRRTYLVMGDAINVAARLASLARPGELLATTELATHAVSDYDLVQIEPFAVKGRKTHVHACSVLGRVGEGAQSERVQLVEREGPLAELAEAWQEVTAGRGCHVELVGADGMGKTALLSSATEFGRSLLVRADPSMSTTPYASLRDLLRKTLGSAAADVTSLSTAVAALDPELLPWLPLIGQVLDLDPPITPEVESLDERFRRHRLESTVVALLSRLLTEPVVVALDDVDDMDEASAHLVGRIAEAASGRPWLVITAHRQALTNHGLARRIELEKLSDAAAGKVARSLLAGAPATSIDVAAIVQRAQGNPLFLQVLVTALRAGDCVADLPQRVEDVVVRHIDRLDPTDRRLLRLAAVLGESFPRGLFEEVARVQGIVIDEVALAPLTGLLFADADSCTFEHRLLRDTAYEGLSHRVRRAVHASAAVAIETSTTDPEAMSDVLSYHYLMGGRADLAWHYAPLAAERAVAKYAYATAQELYERAVMAGSRLRTIKAQDRARMHLALARVQRRTGDLEAALASFARARRGLAGSQDAVVGVLVDEASLQQRMGRNSAAMRSIRRGLRVLEGASGNEASRLRSELAMVGSGVRVAQGRYADALSCARLADAEGAASGDAEAQAHAASVVFSSLLMMGRPCSDEGRTALEVNERAGLLLGQAEVLNNLAVLSWMEGRGEESLAEFGAARERALMAGDELQATFTLVNEGDILARLGRSAEAVAVIDEALPSLLAQRSEAFEAAARRARAMALLDLGDVQDAMVEVDIAREIQYRLGESDEVAETDTVRARVLLAMGRVEEARSRATAALDAVRANHAMHLLALALRTQADVLMAEGETENAGRLLQEALAACDGHAESERVSVLAALARLGDTG